MRVALLAFCLVLGSCGFAHAQGMAPYFSAVGPGSYHHASTAAEGAARGMADVVRSAGAANLMNSEAAINIEQARSQNIANHLQYTQTYFQMKSINQQYRDAQRTPPPSQQQAIRMSQERMPERLTSNKIDPLTGDLAWPIILRLDEFGPSRLRMEQLYADRAEKGYFTPQQFQEVRQIVGQMTEELRNHTRQFGGNASIEARRFLESLSFEAGFQAG